MARPASIAPVTPYLERACSVEALVPWLYLKGIFTDNYQLALSALRGDQAKGLSPNTVSRLNAQWLVEHKANLHEI